MERNPQKFNPHKIKNDTVQFYCYITPVNKTYLIIMLVVTHLLTQRSSCIGRVQLDKRESLFVQAQNVTYFVVRDVNSYMMRLSSNHQSIIILAS